MVSKKVYVPILKWKRGEKRALSNLRDDQKSSIRPLIQLVMSRPQLKDINGMNEDEVSIYIEKLFTDNLPKVAKEIKEHWGYPAFLDVSLLTSLSPLELKIKAFQRVISDTFSMRNIIIPVINFSDNELIHKSVINLAKEYNTGICLKLVCANLLNIDLLNAQLKIFLHKNNLNFSDIDLIIDIKEVNEKPDKVSLFFDLAQNITNISSWRSFIFSSGAFPSDLSNCKFDEENYIDRLEWKCWLNKIKKSRLSRIPSFSDYTIQHPIYNESFQFFPPSTSIKYALDDKWFILKGRVKQFGLYLANAKLLVGRPEFFGADFSYGDSYIFEKAGHFEVYMADKSKKGTGTAETWLSAGINHHLACVANQLSNVF